MAKFSTIADAFRKAIATSMQVRSYEFTFPRTNDFHLWLPAKLDDPGWTRRWMSKSQPSALYNQIIEREWISVRSFPPGSTETECGVYVIGDAEEGDVLYIGKSQCKGTPVVVRLIDHFVPPLEKYRNSQRMQNTPLFWDRHIGLGKKLQVIYCDNMQGPLAPDLVEFELRQLAYNLDGDYPPYDGHSRFARSLRSQNLPRASLNAAAKAEEQAPMNEPGAVIQPAALATAASGETLASFLDRLLASDLPLEKIVAAAKALSDQRGLRTKVTAGTIRAHIAFRKKHPNKSF